MDGKVAYTGGFNLSDEYINKKAPYGKWKDNGIRMEGDAAWRFTILFYSCGTVSEMKISIS